MYLYLTIYYKFSELIDPHIYRVTDVYEIYIDFCFNNCKIYFN